MRRNTDHGMPQLGFQVAGQGSSIFKHALVLGLAQTNQILLTTPSLHFKIQDLAQLGVVAQLGVRIQGQMIGIQIDVVR